MRDSDTKFLHAFYEATCWITSQSETLELPADIMALFLACAIHGTDTSKPGQSAMSLEELAERLGRPTTTISYQLRYLAHHYREGKPGMGLVALVGHPESGRKKTFGLTRKGDMVVDRLEEIFAKAAQ